MAASRTRVIRSSEYLEVVQYSDRSGHFTRLVKCPARLPDGTRCKYDLSGHQHTSEHIATHAPEDFGLTPIE